MNIFIKIIILASIILSGSILIQIGDSTKFTGLQWFILGFSTSSILFGIYIEINNKSLLKKIINK